MYTRRASATAGRVTTALVAALVMVTAIAVPLHTAAQEHPAESRAVSVQILHTNDHHSYLESSSYDLAFDGVPTRVQMGGFSRVATLISRMRDENTLVLNSGELNGTLFFSLFQGEVDFKVFNRLGIDAYALGNHEFDEGDARLAELIEMANFPVVSSNALPTAASPLYAVRDSILPYVIKEIDGERVAIIGILKVEKTKNSSLVSDDVTFTPEIDTARRVVEELEAQGINKIILLSHVGYYNDVLFAQNVPGIDVIVGGDTHSLLGDEAQLETVGLAPDYHGQTGPFEGLSHTDVEAEPNLGNYPTTVIGPTGDPVHVVQAWSYAYGLGVLQVDFDDHGVAVRAEGGIRIPVAEPFLQVGDDGARREVSDDVAEEIYAAIERSPVAVNVPVSQDVEAVIAPYHDRVEEAKTEVIGRISETMGYERIPTPFSAGEDPTGSYAAYVVAQAFRQTNPAIDVAIQNAGGVRTQFLQGEFTLSDAIAALPFSNTVVMLEMTGREIVQVLNEGAHYALNSGSTGAFPYAAGLRYDIDLDGDSGEVVRNVEAQDRESGQWAPIDYAAMYTVSTNSFTALGKDNYLTFGEVREEPGRFEDTYINYSVPLKEYIEGLPNQVLPPVDTADYCLKSVR